MVEGGGAPAMSHGVRNTIRSIKEIVGDHSESDIYAVLKETNMDPNETTQRLLDQDPFHEVRRRRDRKKENANGTSINDITTQNESRIERRIPNERRTESKQNENRIERRIPTERRAELKQNINRPNINSENRTELKNNNNYNNNNNESRTEGKDNGESSMEYKKQNENRAEFVKTEQIWDRNGYNNYNKYNTRSARGGFTRTSRGGLTRNPIPVPVKEYRIVRDNRNKPKADEEQSEPVSAQNLDSSNAQTLNSDQTNNTSKQEPIPLIQPTKSNQPKKESTAEICSSSDPIHVSVGLIRREVGVVGLRKPNPNSDTKNSNSIQVGNSKGFTAENQRQHLRPNSRGNNRLGSQPLTSLNQYSGKSQQVNMEWRPKSSQSPRNGPALTLTSQSQQKEDSNISSESLAKLKVSEDQYVIIPDHLRVPESEQTRLVFGSFDSPKKSNEGNNHASLSSVSVPPTEKLPRETEPNTEITEAQLRESANMQQGPSDEAGPQDDLTEDISNYESTLPHDLQDNSADLQNFKEFDPHSRYDMQFLSSVREENSATQETTVIPTEAMSVGPSILPSPQIPIINAPTMHQHQNQTIHLNSSQQVPQMYPQHPQQLQFPPNYLPYRHVFSPVYMPQQLNYQNTPPLPNYQNAPTQLPLPNYQSAPGPLQNYQSAPGALQNYQTAPGTQLPLQNYQNAPGGAAYPPPIPSPVPNYLLMPTSGAGTVPAGGVKYGAGRYEAVFGANGYGNYGNGGGYPGLVEDASRMKYKDNNTLYAPNMQVEASDIWVQTPREHPSIQSTQFYQAQPATPSYLTHNGPATYSATQQYAHQTGQPGSMTLLPPPPGPLNLSGLGAPAGAFQGNHQLGHLGWTAANF